MPTGQPEGLGRLGVAQAQDLGQHEGGPQVGGEAAQQVIEVHLARGVGADVDHVLVPPGADAPASDPAADLVDADVAGDPEQPEAHRAVAPEAGKGGDGPGVDVLGQVVRALSVDQVGAQAPDVGLGPAHQVGQRDPVTTGGPEGELVEPVVGFKAHGNQTGGWGDR